jgi:hypothetical protein
MKMKDFSKRIPVEQDFCPEFFFHVLHSASVQRYHVSVTDGNRQNIFFTMEQRASSTWRIINAPKVPDWIMPIEKHLEEAIVENLKS